MSAFLSNLQPNTVYSFQACASNQYGQNCGNVLTFITTNTNAYVPVQPIYPPCQTGCGPSYQPPYQQPPIIIYTNNGGDNYGVGTSALATIKLSASKREVFRDDYITFIVTLENNSNRKLKNVEMHFNAPADMVLTSTSMGEISFASNSVTVSFPSLASGDSKTVTINAHVEKNTKVKSFVVHADASYLNTKTDQRETVTAELMIGTAKLGLFAGAFGAGWTGGLIWFLIALLIILLLWLIFTRERRYEEVREIPAPPSRWPSKSNI
jgi:hypothetical protein